MKIIKLNESQFNKLFEDESSKAPSFDGGDLKEYPGSEVKTTANVTNMDGDATYGKQPTTDKIAKQLAIQNYWANVRNGSRVMP
jgi:hypothetical protein